MTSSHSLGSVPPDPLSPRPGSTGEPSDRQFEFLLNALERAAQQDEPFKAGYSEKRKALFAFVDALRAENAELRAENDDLRAWVANPPRMEGVND